MYRYCFACRIHGNILLSCGLRLHSKVPLFLYGYIVGIILLDVHILFLQTALLCEQWLTLTMHGTSVETVLGDYQWCFYHYACTSLKNSNYQCLSSFVYICQLDALLCFRQLQYACCLPFLVFLAAILLHPTKDHVISFFLFSLLFTYYSLCLLFSTPLRLGIPAVFTHNASIEQSQWCSAHHYFSADVTSRSW